MAAFIEGGERGMSSAARPRARASQRRAPLPTAAAAAATAAATAARRSSTCVFISLHRRVACFLIKIVPFEWPADERLQAVIVLLSGDRRAARWQRAGK